MKYIILSLISGLLFAVSWPTYGIPFFIFFAFIPLLLAEHHIVNFSTIKRKAWSVFGLAYLSFLIWNSVTTGWLYNAQNPDGSKSLLAVLFPVLTNSFFMAMVFMLYHWYKKIEGTYFGLFFFVAIWMCFEKLHLAWEFTWPWLNLGNAFADYHQFIQWYDTLGATGGSFWILLVNIAGFYTLRIWEASRNRQSLIKNSSLFLGLILVPISISLVKYNTYEAQPIGQINVTMLQPALDPYNEKYEKDSIQIVKELLDIAQKHSTLKNGNKVENIDFYLSPETSFPGYGSISERGFKSSQSIHSIKEFLLQHPQSIFIGGISTHYVYENEEEKNAKSKTASLHSLSDVWFDEYNSAIQITPNQKEDVYHKGKLVPGVEIFPYINFFKPLLGNVMLDLGGTTRSLGIDTDRKVFTNNYNAAKVAPIICYESVYGEFVGDFVKKGANVLAIVTNDSWWGYSQGHKQLLALGKLRAIETRREIARSANSGTSAHINSRGDILDDLPYGADGALAAKVNLLDHETFYVKSGDLLSRIMMFSVGFLILFIPGRRFLQKKK